MDLPFLDKLVGVKKNADGSISCKCPCCAESGGDSKNSHLRIYKNLAYNCVKDSSKEHNRRIYEILYSQVIPGDLDNWREAIGVQEDKIEMVKVYPESLLEKLVKEHGYWENRGVKESVLEKIGSGCAALDEASKLSGRYIFPCRNTKNQLVGFAGRLIRDNDLSVRWKILGSKKNFIFPPVNLSLPSIRKEETIILVEGIGCSLAMCNYGY